MSKHWSGQWHCNPETGNVARCYAEFGKCPFPKEYHSSVAAKAIEAFERSMQPEKLKTLTKGRPRLEQYSIKDAKIFPLFSQQSGPLLKNLTQTQLLEFVKGRAVSCPDCGKVLGGRIKGVAALMMENYTYTVYCTHCERSVENTDVIIEPNVNSPTYGAIEPENVKKMTWYHYSDNPQWATSILEEGGPEYIHLGGELAAADRAGYSGSSARKNYIFVVTVDEEADIDEHLDQDDSSDYNPPSTGKDVYRYLNRYEDIGSISLAANPKKIKVLGMAPFDLKLLEKVGTYNVNQKLSDALLNKYNDKYEDR